MNKEKLTISDWAKYPKVKVRVYGDNISYDVHFVDIKNGRLYLRTDPFDLGDNRDDVSVEDCQLELRSLDQLTEDEILEIGKIIVNDNREFLDLDTILIQMKQVRIADYLRSIGIDVDRYIENGKAVKV